MYDFAYHRPKSLAEATAALKGKPEARPMSGGMTLIPTLKQRLAKPSDVVDLGGIKELAGIKSGGDGFHIGANTTLSELAEHADLSAKVPLLTSAALSIASPLIRNFGTVGGNVN